MMSDPDYAEPHASLGLSYFLDSMIFRGSLEHTVSTIRTEATEALRLDPSEPGPHLLLGAIAAAYEYDWQKAGEHFSLATSGTSVPVDAHWACATLYLQPLGRFREAVVHMEQAVARDPLNAFWRGVLASHLAHAEQYDRAIEQARAAVEIDATSFVPHFTLGEAYATMGRWPQAIHALERAHELSPHDAMTTGLLAGALVRNGESARGAVLVRELGETPRPLIGRALYHVLSLETPLAADWYERAIRGRDPFALVFANTPLLTTFRQTDQWPKLASLMKLPDA
jgi:tetratricopeptide (TPR) repeat protein